MRTRWGKEEERKLTKEEEVASDPVERWSDFRRYAFGSRYEREKAQERDIERLAYKTYGASLEERKELRTREGKGYAREGNETSPDRSFALMHLAFSPHPFFLLDRIDSPSSPTAQFETRKVVNIREKRNERKRKGDAPATKSDRGGKRYG